MKESVLSMKAVTVEQNELRILHQIDLDVFASAITGVVYENDAERDALVGILTGEVAPSSGKIKTNDESKRSTWVIGREPLLFRELDISSNLYLQARPSARKRLTEELFARIGIPLDPGKSIRALSPIERIQMELAQGYLMRKQCIVFLELANILSNDEIDQIMPLVRQIRSYGCAFVVLDTYLSPLLTASDRIYFIRNGNVVDFLRGREVQEEEIRTFLNEEGRSSQKGEVCTNGSDEENDHDGRAAFRIRRIGAGRKEEINIAVHGGEIVKIRYADPAVAESLVSAVVEPQKSKVFRVLINEREVCCRGYKDTLRHGIGIIPTNPLDTLLFREMTVRDSLLYPLSLKIKDVYSNGRYLGSIKQTLAPYISPSEYGKKIKNTELKTRIAIIYAKWLLFAPDVLICVNPFPHLNRNTSRLIEQIISDIADRGVAIIILAPNWPTYVNIPGRVIELPPGPA